MTTYSFFANLTAVQPGPGVAQGNIGVPGNLPPGSQGVFLPGGAGSLVAPAAGQGFTVQVNGSGAVSATVQPFASNDGVNWVAYGSAITASGPAGVGVNTGTGTGNFAWYTAQLTAISGTGAVASCGVNA